MALFTRLKEKGAQGEPTQEKNTTNSPKESFTETIYASNTTKTRDSNDGHTKREYTEQQVEIVRRVKRAGGDFYAVLNVQKTADEAEVKKSYKKVCFLSKSDANIYRSACSSTSS